MEEKFLQKSYTIALDDDPSVHKIIQKVTGMTCLPFKDPEALKIKASSFSPAAVFVDIHLGLDICGLDIIPHLRSKWNYTPIFVITSDNCDLKIGEALIAGANDFIRKPFTKEELNGRLVSRVAEMNNKQSSDEFKAYDVRYNKYFRTISSLNENDTVHLANIEAKLFTTLVESRGVTLPREVLKRTLWGNTTVSENALDKKISSLRKSLSVVSNELELKSIYGSGVRLFWKNDETKKVV